MVHELIYATLTLFAILDVIGLIPIYLGFFKNGNKKLMGDYAKRTAIWSGIILGVFLFFGSFILKYFSISLSDFKIAGGLLLLILGLKFTLGLRVLDPKRHQASAGFAVVPFATPLLVGPGSITSVIILVNAHGYLIPLVAGAINILIIWLVLKNCRILYKVLGTQGSDIATRIMGLFITAIAVSFIRTGLSL